MPHGVLATVTWRIKPEFVDACVQALREMFPTTRLKKGFRSIRLLQSEIDPIEFIMIQEWDQIQDHQAYMQFRAETGDLAKLIAMTASPPQIGYWSMDPLAAANV